MPLSDVLARRRLSRCGYSYSNLRENKSRYRSISSTSRIAITSLYVRQEAREYEDRPVILYSWPEPITSHINSNILVIDR